MKNKLKILEESCAHEKEKVRIKAEKGLLARVEKERNNYDARHKCYEQTTKTFIWYTPKVNPWKTKFK